MTGKYCYHASAALLAWVVSFGGEFTANAAPAISQPPDGYVHDRYAPKPDIRRVFRAFIVSFDSKDDDTGDDREDLLRVPHWVAQEIRRWEPAKNMRDDDTAWCLDTLRPRPKWFTDQELYGSGVAPNDDSYRSSGYERGHMAMKLLAERLSQAAAYNTFTLLNAVPQHGKFNKGIWKELEYLTGAWAQTYGKVWVLQGTVFLNLPHRWIGDDNERKVAVPDALFKVVVREKTGEEKAASETDKNEPEILAFLFPQLGPGYFGPSADYRHERYLTSVDEIERLTGLDFPMGTNPVAEERLESLPADKLWQPERVDSKNRRLFLAGCRQPS